MLAVSWSGAVLGVGVGVGALYALLLVLPEVPCGARYWETNGLKSHESVLCRGGNWRAVFPSLVWLTCYLRNVNSLYICCSTTSGVWSLLGCQLFED